MNNQQKLNYRFHNPNTIEQTANCLLNILIKANTNKVEEVIKANSEVVKNIA